MEVDTLWPTGEEQQHQSSGVEDNLVTAPKIVHVTRYYILNQHQRRSSNIPNRLNYSMGTALTDSQSFNQSKVKYYDDSFITLSSKVQTAAKSILTDQIAVKELDAQILALNAKIEKQLALIELKKKLRNDGKQQLLMMQNQYNEVCTV